MANLDKKLSRRAARRPRDLVNLLIALGSTVLVSLIGILAAQTTAGIDADLATVTRELPSPILFLLNTIGATAIIFVPIVVAVSLISRSRARQLIDALLAAGLTVITLISLSIFIVQFNSPRVLIALTGSTNTSGSDPLDPLIAGLVAYLVIARIFDRGKLFWLATLSIISLILVNLVAGGTTIVAQIINVLLGWSIGLLVRYALGTPINRASQKKIEESLISGGIEFNSINLLSENSEGRIFRVIEKSGSQLNVWVFDWELQGSGVIGSWWRGLTIRTSGEFKGMSIRRRVERTALLSFAIKANSVKVPEVRLVREIEPDSIYIALEHLEGSAFADLTQTEMTLSDEQIKKFLEDIKNIHNADIAHRALSAENVWVTKAGEIVLTSVHSGTIAATELQQRVDLAEALVTCARTFGVSKTVKISSEVFSTKELVRIIPAIQSVAMSKKTRDYLHVHKNLLKELRQGLGSLALSADVESIQFQRINFKNILLALFSLIAIYVLIPQFSQINIRELAQTAQWGWAGIALLGSALTYLASTALLLSFVTKPVKWIRALQAQLAASFATLVTPPTLGSVAVNIRFLNKSGVPGPAAATAVGVSQVVIFAVHVILLIITGIAAGTQSDFSFRPSRTTLIIFVIIFALIIGIISIKQIRQLIIEKASPILSQAGPTLSTIAQEPQRLIISAVSSILLNLFYVITFYASLKAFGGSIAIATIAFVYLAGATLGQAAPTPGGIGAVEAALIAGLTAAGISSGTALSGVLLYRIVTFWLPVLPGWFYFAYLQKKNAL